MALIKCPECGKDVSTSADACPHCGYPINKTNLGYQKVVVQHEKEDRASWPAPKDKSWINKWKGIVRTNKNRWTIVFFACLIGLAIFICLLCLDRETITHSYSGGTYITTRSKTVYIVFTGIFAFFSFVAFILWIVVLVQCFVRIREYDGYVILVYVGFKNCLVVEDEIQDSGIISRFMYGHLPNQKQVWISISTWDGSVKMGIGKEGDEKNIL